MIHKYHQDAYLFEFSTKLVKVILQEKFTINVAHGTQEKKICNGVVLEDTIMFPEGGGQPPDHGTLTFEGENDKTELKVWYVVKNGNDIVHLIEEGADLTRLQPGVNVHQKLDKERRLYHMKQHTGQHLISSLAEDHFKMNTVAWFLGSEISHIELSIDKRTIEEVTSKMKQVEQMANDLIRKQVEVTAVFAPKDDPIVDQASTRGLPKDHTGDVRLINIKGVNINMCCGTHVSNLVSLEVIKFLGCKLKKKGFCFAYFVVGEEYFGRVFDKMKQREESICAILNTNADDIVPRVKDQKEKLLLANKKMKALMEAQVMLELEIFKIRQPKVPLFSHHFAEGGMDLIYFVASQRQEIGVENLSLFLTSGEGEMINMFIAASQEIMEKIMPKILELGGVGKNLKEFRYQGKLNRNSRTLLEESIVEALTVSLCEKN